VHTELKAATDVWKKMGDSGIFVIPIRLGECDPPKYLKDLKDATLSRHIPQMGRGHRKTCKAMGILYRKGQRNMSEVSDNI
jgi:hypothetical protein